MHYTTALEVLAFATYAVYGVVWIIEGLKQHTKVEDVEQKYEEHDDNTDDEIEANLVNEIDDLAMRAIFEGGSPDKFATLDGPTTEKLETRPRNATTKIKKVQFDTVDDIIERAKSEDDLAINIERPVSAFSKLSKPISSWPELQDRVV